ncbi:cytochrome c biogenesis protein ResB [Naasia lichenicola]|uniref:cytochrome c biogenesis protein ResB n=1 Tax=Naasia lichenicola TaxID=2565933 RepID=UPI003F698A5E
MHRPSDHVDSAVDDSGADGADAGGTDGISAPKLGPIGWLRFAWRQLTSMRTALFLLLFLAIAAVPGSLVPQRSSDPNGVSQYLDEHPDLFPIIDAVQGFDVYSSVWFTAIYLLLFISLIGCVLPRTKHHWQAMRAKPPRTPARLERMQGLRRRTLAGDDVEQALAAGERVLKSKRYRVVRYGDSLSAERGYLRETGNLIFHGSLVGILVAVAIGGSFGYNGNRVVVTGESFVNYIGGYDSFTRGRLVTDDTLSPYRLRLDDLQVTYEQDNANAIGAPLDYTASVTVQEPNSTQTSKKQIKVNEPLRVNGTNVYLLGNGYAPHLTIRDPDGTVVFSGSVPFLPQNAQLFSTGIIKVPDGLSEQVGIIGLLYPTKTTLDSGALASSFPDLDDPLLTLSVYTGDLGLDQGIPKSVYQLDTTDLTLQAGRNAPEPAPELTPGATVDLPNGLGTVTLDSIDRFASLEIHDDPTQAWVLAFAILVLAGLAASLFVPRRRLWLKVRRGSDGELSVEYAGLARGDDPRLDEAVQEFADRHSEQLGGAAQTGRAGDGETKPIR